MPEFDPAGASTPDLLSYFGAILDELKSRGVVRTRNNPVADYAEWLVSRALGLILTGNSSPGYDAESSRGERFQVKARRLQTPRGSRQLSVIRNLEAAQFDYLVAVLFDKDFAVMEAYKFPRPAIPAFSRFSAHQNGHILVVQGAVLGADGVEDVTSSLRRAAAK